MERKAAAIAASVLVVLTVCMVSPTPGLADEPGIWTKTDGVNEITPALTEGTATFEDDEASEFVHEIQWDNVDAFADEDAWQNDADGADGSASDGVISASEALAWVHDNIALVDDETNYVVPEAWANPEQTLNLASGDSEDLAFLLASLLKWHTDEVNIGEGDLVYAVCGFVLPPVDEFHAWVFWYDASEIEWYQLNPTSGEMNGILYPALGTLWLNDEHVWGFLPGYYPGPLPPVAGYDRDDFFRIAEGGFGDPMNNYPWSMAYFNGDLYVGTGRHIPWRLLQVILGPAYEFQQITYPRGDTGSQQWAEDMRAEIWRHGSWERVYQSPVIGGPPFTPRESGFRQMVVFDGEIYAASGGGFSVGGLLLKSTDGTTWEQVVTPPEMGTDSRAMVVHNEKLYRGIGGAPEVWAFPSDVHTWERVADFSLVDPYTNTAVISLESFNGHLYAGTQNLESGYQVFRSEDQAPSEGNWKQIVKYGGGDMMNYWAGTMEVFNNQLYVGSMSLPLIVADPVELGPPKGFELIRISTDDSWELVVGDCIPRIPSPGPTFRFPGSGWPGGFGNFFNFYCWSLQENDGVLYLGTFDASSFLRFLPVEDLAELIELTPEQQEQIAAALEQVIGLLEGLGVNEDYIEPFRRLLEAFDVGDAALIDWEEVWQVFTDFFAGGDLWKTEDGVWWEPVTLNGFDNPDNYGVRSMVHVNPLFVGMANPFQGCEVWRAPLLEAESTDGVGVGKDTYTTGEPVYATGSGFSAFSFVDVYIVGDLAWTDGMAIPPDVSSDGMNAVPTDAVGNLGPANVWPPPLTPGEYDVVFDANRDGTYDVGTDIVDDPNHPGFTVGYPIGGIVVPVNRLELLAPWLGLAALASLAALTVALVRRRRSG